MFTFLISVIVFILDLLLHGLVGFLLNGKFLSFSIIVPCYFGLHLLWLVLYFLVICNGHKHDSQKSLSLAYCLVIN